MRDGEVLSADGCDAVEVCEIVELEVAQFTTGELFSGLRADDLVATPVREAVGAIRAAGVGLGGELGHAIFIVNGGIRELKKVTELAVEVGLSDVTIGSLIAASFEK